MKAKIPGLQFLFSAMAGYEDLKAKDDLDQFFTHIDRPRGIHLCGNPDWDFLLNLDLDVLSMDVYTNADIFSSYAASLRKFLERGGVIVWGIVPTGFEAFSKEEVPSLIPQNPLMGIVFFNLYRTGHHLILDFRSRLLHGITGFYI